MSVRVDARSKDELRARVDVLERQIQTLTSYASMTRGRVDEFESRVAVIEKTLSSMDAKIDKVDEIMQKTNYDFLTRFWVLERKTRHMK